MMIPIGDLDCMQKMEKNWKERKQGMIKVLVIGQCEK